MATFITRVPGSGNGVRLAVKDLIDVAGVPTTAGSRALAATAVAAERDAPCLAGARAADARIVGKANLDELAFGASGVNEHFGTPVNPLDPSRVPGGSSSGSAVAVAGGEADLAYGSDTGGSIRVPAAFCGITGLKTTHGRIPLAGVWPLAPSMDTIGPMARDVAGAVAGLRLLEPGFSVDVAAAAGPGRAGTLARQHGGGDARDRLARARDGSVLPAATRGRDQVGLPRTHQPGESGGFSGIGAAGADRAAAARQSAAHRRTERRSVVASHRRDDRGSGLAVQRPCLHACAGRTMDG
jgi:Amidase